MKLLQIWFTLGLLLLFGLVSQKSNKKWRDTYSHKGHKVLSRFGYNKAAFSYRSRNKNRGMVRSKKGRIKSRMSRISEDEKLIQKYPNKYYWEYRVSEDELAKERMNNQKAQAIYNENQRGRDQAQETIEIDLVVKSQNENAANVRHVILNDNNLYYTDSRNQGYQGVLGSMSLESIDINGISQVHQSNFGVRGSFNSGYCLDLQGGHDIWRLCGNEYYELEQFRQQLMGNISKQRGIVIMNFKKQDCSNLFSIDYNYHSQNSWGCMCSDLDNQSPINIDTKTAQKMSRSFMTRYKRSNSIEIKKTKQESIVRMGRSDNQLEYNNDHYSLEQIRFKFRSEHEIDGHSYDGELQLIHRNEFDDRLILSVFLERGGNNGDQILDGLEWYRWVDQDDLCFDSKIDLNQIFELTGKSYYGYYGSDSLPPCNESVKWLVIEKPLEISGYLMNEMEQKVTKGSNNNRRIQHWSRNVDIYYHYEPGCGQKVDDKVVLDSYEPQIVKARTVVDHYAVVPKHAKMRITDGLQMGQNHHKVKFQVMDSQQMERKEPRIKNQLQRLLGNDIYNDIFRNNKK